MLLYLVRWNTIYSNQFVVLRLLEITFNFDQDTDIHTANSGFQTSNTESLDPGSCHYSRKVVRPYSTKPSIRGTCLVQHVKLRPLRPSICGTSPELPKDPGPQPHQPRSRGSKDWVAQDYLKIIKASVTIPRNFETYHELPR